MRLSIYTLIRGLIISCLCFQHAFAASAAGEPNAIFADVRPIQIIKKNKNNSADSLQLEMSAYGQSFKLMLQTNKRLLKQMQKQVQAGSPEIYAGTVEGVSGSWARITRVKDKYVGAFYDGNELYLIDTKVNVSKQMKYRDAQQMLDASAEDTVIYKSSDVETNASCGMGSHGMNGTMSFQALTNELQGLSLAATAAAEATLEIDLLIVADTQYVSLSGGDVVGEVMSQMNVVDGIFSEQVGVHLNVVEIRSLSNNGTLTSTDTGILLTDFQAYVANSGGHPGLGHLFSGKNFNGNNVGRAFIDSLCDSFGVGVTQTGGQGVLGAIFAAHEIGHNFGAPHDGDTAFNCGFVSQGFLMWPTISGNQTQFSQCSLDQIAPAVANAQCINPIQSDIPIITSTPSELATVGFAYTYDNDNQVEVNGVSPISYSLNIAPSGMTISSTGVVNWTPQPGQEGSNPVEIVATNLFGSGSQEFDIFVAAAPSNDIVSFTQNLFSPYIPNEDRNGTVVVENAGATVRITGNRWVKIDLPYTVTADTVIEFDFSSSVQGEIHGIGLASNQTLNANLIFKLHGIQTAGNQTFDDYPGFGTRHYIIPVGQFYTPGQTQYLFFVMDDDSGATGESVFSNVQVYEDVPLPPPGTAPQITSTPGTFAVVGSPYVYDADNRVDASGTSPIAYSLGNAPSGMVISSAGVVSWTPQPGQEGTRAVQVVATNAFGSNSQSFNILVAAAPSNDIVSFTQNLFSPYIPNEDRNGTVVVENAGATVRITGNRWVKIDLPYTVTANTVIEFDFSSSVQGEIHGIGLASNQTLNANLIFKLHGTQAAGNQTFDDYPGFGTRHYIIPVGQFYTPGQTQYLFFVMDDDSGASGESVFSNVQVYEDVPLPPPGTAPQITSTPGTSAVVGSPYVYDADNRVDASGTSPITYSLGNAPSGMVISSAGVVSWTPQPGQEGTRAVQVVATNAFGSNSQSFNILVAAAPSNDIVSFTQNLFSPYIPNEDRNGTIVVENAGATVRITGNRWVKIDLPYTVTANTVIEFDFSSSVQGEIHGIGLASNQTLNANLIFKLHGTQAAGNQTFDDYPGFGTRHYIIPVGQFYTPGQTQYLFFVMDDDSGASGESVFSNVQVYEDVPLPPPGTAPQITSTPGTSAVVGSPYVYDADNRVDASGTSPITYSLGNAPSGMVISSAGVVSWTPQPGQEGTRAVQVVATNAFGSNSQSFNILVAAAPSNDIVSFTQNLFSPYIPNEDRNGTVVVENAGATVRITGNRWVKIDLPYTVTANTVIEFDFSSSVQGEIHGIGLASNQTLNANLIFKLHGTQAAGNQTFDDYPGFGTRHYIIPVGQFYTPGQTQYLFFVMDDDSGASGESVFSNVKIFENAQPQPSTVNFIQYPLTTYLPSEDLGGTVVVENAGNTVRITGNRWVKVDLPYAVTANTVLEFDFSSGQQGEIHGIGMAANQVFNSSLIFKLYGTQAAGNQTFDNYPGSGTRHYFINIGQYYTAGQRQHLFFVMDHDAGSNGESVFSNVKVYEQ